MEIGQSVNVKDRALDHTENLATNNIFGLNNAWVRKYPDPPVPSPEQFFLFRVWKCDDNLLNVSEIFASILCSSYNCLGGMNPVLAGGGSFYKYL